MFVENSGKGAVLESFDAHSAASMPHLVRRDSVPTNHMLWRSVEVCTVGLFWVAHPPKIPVKS